MGGQILPKQGILGQFKPYRGFSHFLSLLKFPEKFLRATPPFYGLKIRFLTFSWDLNIAWVMVLSVGFCMTNKGYHANYNEGHFGAYRASLATGYHCKPPPPFILFYFLAIKIGQQLCPGHEQLQGCTTDIIAAADCGCHGNRGSRGGLSEIYIIWPAMPI